MISLITLLLAIPHTVTFSGTLMFKSTHPVFQRWGFGLGQRGQILETLPEELVLPEDSSKTSRGISFVLGIPPETRYALYVPEKGTLYLDTNGDNSLRDERPIVGEYPTGEIYKALTFGPVRVTVRCNGKKASRYFNVLRYDGQWYLSSADLHQFRGAIGDEVVEFALVDTNADGIYSPAEPGERMADFLEWFKATNPDSLTGSIPRYIPLKGTVYQMEVEPDGSAVHFTPTELPLGTLVVKEGEGSFFLYGEKLGEWNARGNEKGIPQPADQYKIRSYRWAFTHHNERWELFVYFEKEGPALEISKDGVTTWTFEKRLIASLGIPAQASSNSYEVSLILKTPDGGTVGFLTKNGQRPPEPKLKILDKNGKVLLTEKFHYG